MNSNSNLPGFKQVETPHYHRLEPTHFEARFGLPETPKVKGFNLPTFVPDNRKGEPDPTANRNPLYFWFDDSGFVFYGADEFTAVRLDSMLSNQPPITAEDLAHAYRAGLVAAHMSHTIKGCEAVGNAIRHVFPKIGMTP